MATTTKTTVKDILVFKKVKEFEKNGRKQKFDTFFATHNNESIGVKFVMDAADQLDDMGIEFPAMISLELGDFFSGTKEYINRHGDKAIEYSLVIKNITAWAPANLPAQDIEDIMTLKRNANK